MITAVVMSDEADDAIESVKDEMLSSELVEVFRMNLQNPESVEKWVKEYSARTNTTWIVEKTKPPESCKRYDLKIY